MTKVCVCRKGLSTKRYKFDCSVYVAIRFYNSETCLHYVGCSMEALYVLEQSLSLSMTVAPAFYQGFFLVKMNLTLWDLRVEAVCAADGQRFLPGCGLQTHLSRHWQPVSTGATQQLSDNEPPTPHQDIKHKQIDNWTRGRDVKLAF